MWGAKAIRGGEQAEVLEDWCRESAVSVRRVMVWPARGVPFYNACVLGLVPRFRYILISEDLLRDCPPEQIKAVLGHELGHARHGHLWFYMVFLVASGMWAQAATEFLINHGSHLLPFIASPIGYALVTVVIWGL